MRRLRCLILILALLLTCVSAQAAPYEFSAQLDYYTWGEGLGKAKEVLGEPYSQDPGGATYLMSGNWMKQILTHEDKIYQIIERVIYAQQDPAADKEYASLKRKIVEMYGPPSEDDVACPDPQPQVKCRISRWNQHPVTQVFLAHSQARVQSIMLGVTSKEIRQQALRNPQKQQILSVGQLVGAFQQDSAGAFQKYGGQRVRVMGMSGGLFRDGNNKLCLRVYNSFNPAQKLVCFMAANLQADVWLPPEGTLVINGTVGQYEEGVVKMFDCEIGAPSE